jgi:hypothetical protein
MATRVYCTYFDHNYMSRGLALYHSLQRRAPGARLWVLCLTEACYKPLLKLGLPDLVPCSLAEFEAADLEVAATRPQRSTIEYYFTCTPAWMRFVQGREADARVGHLSRWLSLFLQLSGADLWRTRAGFGRDHSVSSHGEEHVAEAIRHLQCRLGRCAQRDDGRRVIEWWRQKCIEWCRDYVDCDRFADEGYLDTFCGLSPRVKVIEHIGANLAPWNIGHYRIAFESGEVRVDDRPLIFFHFQA